MRKALLTLFFSLLISASAWAQYEGLIISEVVHGTNRFRQPKYVELYNAATYNISLQDLAIRRYANESSTPAQLLLGNVILAPEETFVAASSADTSRWPFENPPDITDFLVINGNGNDVYEIYNTVTTDTIDVYGVIGEVTGRDDYSPTWEYEDKQVTRTETFNIGNSGNFVFNPNEWTITPYADEDATPGVHFATPLVPLPVELASFEALTDGDVATLAWTTASEENNAGFHVEHRRAATSKTTGTFEAVGFVNGAGTTSEASAYRFQTDALEAGRHVFRLRQVDFDGTVSYSSEVELAVASALPQGYRLSAAYPNPFNPQTQFTLSVRQAQEVRVEVFNLLGQRVRLLHEGPLEPEREHTFTFEAGDLPSGLYLYRAQGETFVSSEQVTLLK